MGATSVTLGDLLYADPAITCVPEKEWLALVRAIAVGDQPALRALFEKTFPLVFSYLLLRTGDRRLAENLILEVFESVWCEAPVFDHASSPVLGWIMRHARSSAAALTDTTRSMERGSDTFVASLLDSNLSQPVGGNGSTPKNARLQMALQGLSVAEREVIEAALIDGMSYAELAARHGESVGAVKNRISTGLSKLRRSLQANGDES